MRDAKINWQKCKVLFSFPALAGLLLAGCGKEEATTYSVSKTESAPPSSSFNHANAGTQIQSPPAASFGPVRWTTPSGWEEFPAASSMRVANFAVKQGDKKAEVTIIPFPNKVGTELDNVNMWRRDVNLGPITEAEYAFKNVPVASAEGKFYELIGEQAATLAAVLEKDNTSWFFKIRGDRDVVLESKNAFLDFLKSIRFEANPDAAAPVAATPAASTREEISNDSDDGSPKWTVPATWKKTQPGPMVAHSFVVSEANQKANVSISSFPGDVGGTLANVNRWRAQVSLKPIDADDLPQHITTIDVLGGKATLVDMKGTDKTGKPARLLAASVPQGEVTWFYKFMGDDAVVEQEKPNFIKFVETVRY